MSDVGMARGARIGFLFAGQGAQSVGMGRDLYAAYPAARALYERAAAAVPFDLLRISFEGPEEELKRTDVSQPAIVACSLAALAALEAELEGRFPPLCCVAGLSLGEYSALSFAGALRLEDCLRLVAARGRFMQECCDAAPSGMTSLLGIAAEELGPALEVGRALGPVGIANDNAPGQVVLSGAKAALEAAVEKAKALGAKRALPLNVAGAYHSSLMAPAGERLAAELAGVSVSPPRVPVFANVTAALHPADGGAIKELLVRQVSATVRWRETMSAAHALGVEQWFELGPGGVLKGLVRQNDRARGCQSVLSVEDVKAAAQALAAAAGR